MRQKFDCFLCRNLMAFRAWTLEFWSWDPRLPDQASPGPWTSPFVSFFSSPTSSPNLQSVVQHLLVVVQNHELLFSTLVLVPIRLINDHLYHLIFALHLPGDVVLHLPGVVALHLPDDVVFHLPLFTLKFFYHLSPSTSSVIIMNKWRA